MDNQHRSGSFAALVALAVLCPGIAAADVVGDATTHVARWFEHGAKLWSSLAERIALPSRRPSTRNPLDKSERQARIADAERISVVVQHERETSPETLLFRYRLAGDRGFETYAGAGLSRARYLESFAGQSAVYWIAESRRSYGTAAEVGAAWRIEERLELRAELRWYDHGHGNHLMRTSAGMIDADSTFAGLRLGWRFR
jgi:hypothetical protein